MLIIAALGDNALLGRGQKPDAVIQHRHIRRAARALAPLAAKHELVVCHGNGAQAGLPAREDETDSELSTPYPLDVLGAQTPAGTAGRWPPTAMPGAGSLLRPSPRVSSR